MIYVLYGIYGTGKSTLGKLLEKLGICKLVTHTTRGMRENELNGVDYYFVTEKEFNRTKFVETSSNPTNGVLYYYGLSVSEAQSKLDLGKDVYVVLNREGYANLKEIFGEMIQGIFITVPKEIALERMIKRGDGVEAANYRQKTMVDEEYEKMYEKDFVIVNKSLEDASAQLASIVLNNY